MSYVAFRSSLSLMQSQIHMCCVGSNCKVIHIFYSSQFPNPSKQRVFLETAFQTSGVKITLEPMLFSLLVWLLFDYTANEVNHNAKLNHPHIRINRECLTTLNKSSVYLMNGFGRYGWTTAANIRSKNIALLILPRKRNMVMMITMANAGIKGKDQLKLSNRFDFAAHSDVYRIIYRQHTRNISKQPQNRFALDYLIIIMQSI